MAKIDRNGGPLKQLNELIDWEMLRPELSLLREKIDISKGGRPPIDPHLKFKMLILHSLYNLSDDSLEQQVLDRLSFMRFLGLTMGEDVTEWSDNTRAQKDTDAKWTQKNGKQSFGYKNHIAPDVEHKLVRGFAVTPANVHDSKSLPQNKCFTWVCPAFTLTGVFAKTVEHLFWGSLLPVTTERNSLEHDALFTAGRRYFTKLARQIM